MKKFSENVKNFLKQSLWIFSQIWAFGPEHCEFFHKQLSVKILHQNEKIYKSWNNFQKIFVKIFIKNDLTFQDRAGLGFSARKIVPHFPPICQEKILKIFLKKFFPKTLDKILSLCYTGSLVKFFTMKKIYIFLKKFSKFVKIFTIFFLKLFSFFLKNISHICEKNHNWKNVKFFM